ncbi:MAG: AIR synthase-related protein [Chitinophagaceae bacterium]
MSNLYQQRGVSAQKEDVHEAIKGMDKGLFPNAFCKILPDVLSNQEDACCIMHADTAGTKSILAYLYWKETGDLSVWKNIAQDAMVMNIDDMICAGVSDNFVLSSTIARNKLLIPKEVLKAIIQGCNEVIEEWKKYGINIFHAGGETADVGDLVKTIDVGYTAFARFNKQEVVIIQPKPNDVIVGFASFGKASYEEHINSGIGCNGLTSARHDILNQFYRSYKESYDQQLNEDICYIGQYKLTDTIANESLNIGQMLLSPTRTFAPIIKRILASYRQNIRGIVHNTGGAHSKCLKYIQEPVRIVKDQLFNPPTIFQLIQKASNASWHEMFQVFNMGTRLELYTDKETAKHIIEISKEFAVDAKIIGHVESAEEKSVRILYEGHELVYN